jgi:hypothetical protein
MLPKRRSLFAVRYGEFNSEADMAFVHAPAVEFSAFILDDRETFPRRPPIAIMLRGFGDTDSETLPNAREADFGRYAQPLGETLLRNHRPPGCCRVRSVLAPQCAGR